MVESNLIHSLLKNKLNLFYILALAPLLLIQYFGYTTRGQLFAALIPLYGFLILLIKKDKISLFSEARPMYKIVGLTLMLASFFVYYAVAVFYPAAQFYGVANYAIFILGLFLFFFEVPALKESFTTLFLIAAAIASPLVGKWINPHLEPMVPFFVQAMGLTLTVLGFPIEIATSNALRLQMPGGSAMVLGIEAGCIGIDSFLTFAVIIVVIMMEDPSSLRTKLLWSVAGTIGTFIVNILRVSLIFVVIYYFGFENWGVIHSRIGYVLFIAWLTLFFLILSKRQTILSKFQQFWRRVR